MDSNLLNQFWELLRCPLCRSCPPSTPLFMCHGGHHICNKCHETAVATADALFQADPDRESVDARCTVCKDVVTDIRSLFGEKFVKHYNAWYAMCQGRCNRQICNVQQTTPQRGMWNAFSNMTIQEVVNGPSRSSEYGRGDYLKRYSQSEATVTVTGDSAPSASSSHESVNFADNLSRHTLVRCPKSPCASNFPCSMLVSHFYYNHRDVTPVPVTRHETFTVVFPPAAATDDTALIVCLVYIEDKPKAVTSVHHADLLRNRIPFLLMSSRVEHCVSRRTHVLSPGRDDEETERETEQVWDVTEYVLLWLCGISGTTFKYTMEVTNLERPTKSFTYQGNVVPMEKSLLARDILHSGECALLLPGFVQSVASSQGLDLNITIH